jgi:hypothetical protein
MSDMTLALGMQALGWAVLLPLLVRLASRLNGISPSATSEQSIVTKEAHANV